MGEDLAMLLEMAREGCSDEEILRMLGGATVYIPCWKSICRDRTIVQKLKQGFSIESIAGEYGISLRRVRQIVRHHYEQKKQNATNDFHRGVHPTNLDHPTGQSGDAS